MAAVDASTPGVESGGVSHDGIYRRAAARHGAGAAHVVYLPDGQHRGHHGGGVARDELLQGDDDIFHPIAGTMLCHECTGLPFASENPGVMHACGHDMHTTSLLGAAKILCQLRDQMQGDIMLIFEPSEEKYPGGARMMMDGGLFDEVMPNEIYSFHCLPEMDFGRVGMRKGRYMASTDELYWTVKGKGGHGATPHLSVDPILIASHIVVALQQHITVFHKKL